jgi:hypothetical protein
LESDVKCLKPLYWIPLFEGKVGGDRNNVGGVEEGIGGVA